MACWQVQLSADTEPLAMTLSGDPALAVTLDHVVVLDGGDVPVYNGPYTVTPLVTAQTLATKDRRMTGDVLIHMIPIHETPNAQGGITLNIGGI